MALVPYRRRRGTGLTRLQEEMNDLFGQFFGNWDEPIGRGNWVPALDVAEREEAIVVEAEVPGMKAEDIDISVQDNTLTIRGEKKDEREDQGNNYHHVERRHGAFRRSIPLPGTVDTTKVEAKYHDGVLTIRLPKSEAAKPRKVKIAAE